MQIKKILKTILYLMLISIFGIAFAGCKNSGFVLVEGTTVTGQVKDSEIFISGRTVKIPNFFMCDHEVTQWEYVKTMGENPSYFSSNPGVNEEQINRPVECVSFYDAIVYCNKRSIAEGLNPCYKMNGSYRPIDWGFAPNSFNAEWNAVTCDFSANGYRLPTEAEWEYAARGGKKYIGDGNRQYLYSGNNDIDEVAWYEANSNAKTHEVKEKDPNQLDIYDMSGNVEEWCWDWFGNVADNTKTSRVTRGGNWGEAAFSNRVGVRSNENPAARNYGLGFRLVKTAK